MTAHTIHAQGRQCLACADFATLPTVATYGAFRIVRRSERLYTILDGQGRPVGQNWAYLRNASSQAKHMAAYQAKGQTVALRVLGVQS